MVTNVVGIRFKQAGKIYYFDAGDVNLEPGDYTVVKTSRGIELGHVVVLPKSQESGENQEDLSPVMRKADADDIARAEDEDL